MYKKIRNGMFETNSSSTHVMIIATDSPETIPDFINFSEGQFGWEFDKLQTPNDKASYLITGMILCFGEDRYLDEFNKRIKPLLDKMGVVYNIDIDEENNIYSAYIDHGLQVCEFIDSLLANENLLRKFLFSPYSYVLTGNDNSDIEIEDETPEYKHVKYFKGN